MVDLGLKFGWGVCSVRCMGKGGVRCRERDGIEVGVGVGAEIGVEVKIGVSLGVGCG